MIPAAPLEQSVQNSFKQSEEEELEDPVEYRRVLGECLNDFLRRKVAHERGHLLDKPAKETVSINLHFTLDIAVPFSVRTLDEQKAVETFKMFIEQHKLLDRATRTREEEGAEEEEEEEGNVEGEEKKGGCVIG